MKVLPLWYDRICLEMIRIRDREVRKCSRTKRVCSFCIRLDFNDPRSLHEELRMNSSLNELREHDFAEFLFVGNDDIKCCRVVWHGEGCWRDLFGLRRFFDKPEPYKGKETRDSSYLCQKFSSDIWE